MIDIPHTSVARVGQLIARPEGPRPIVLLGAGCSIKSGVPAAASIAEMAAKWAFCRETGRVEKDPNVTRSDWLPWLQQRKWFDPAVGVGAQYPTVVEHLLQPRHERRRFFASLLGDALTPSTGYRALAELVGKGWIRTLLTTNFDDLARDALRTEPAVVSVETVSGPEDAQLISTDPPYPQLIFVHGRVERYTDLNLVDETQTLDRRLVDALEPLLRDHPLVVIGYRGAEPSVMNDLLGSAPFVHGVFWCARDIESDHLHPNVLGLAERLAGNFQLVEVGGFDEATTAWNRTAPVTLKPKLSAPPDVVPELVPRTDLSLDSLDWAAVDDSLREYGTRLENPLPPSPTRQQLIQRLVEQGFAVRVAGHVLPTQVGALLFASAPTVVVDVAQDGELETIKGNLLEVFDRCIDVLDASNPSYRLKGSRSETVRAYSPATLKELVANALVHRDHVSPASVKISITDAGIQISNPGGLVDDVDATRLGQPGVRGYRNPILADFCFGIGLVDKAGSGLHNVQRWTRENNGIVRFGPRLNNRRFVATVFARAERPDPQTGTADPPPDQQTFMTNLLPVDLDRTVMFVAPATTSQVDDVFAASAGRQIPTFVLLRDSRLITFADPTEEPTFRKVIAGAADRLTPQDFLTDPDEERVLVQTLNRALITHARELGMLAVGKENRLYYPGEEGDARTITYRARTKTATRTVAKPIRSADGEKIRYWEHHAVRFQFRRFGNQWGLLIVPGWVFTTDGQRNFLRGDRVGPLATRRSAREYNGQVANHLYFWAAMLCPDDDRTVFPDPTTGVGLSRHYVMQHVASSEAASKVHDEIDLLGADPVDLIHADEDDVEDELAAIAAELLSDETTSGEDRQ